MITSAGNRLDFVGFTARTEGPHTCTGASYVPSSKRNRTDDRSGLSNGSRTASHAGAADNLQDRHQLYHAAANGAHGADGQPLGAGLPYEVASLESQPSRGASNSSSSSTVRMYAIEKERYYFSGGHIFFLFSLGSPHVLRAHMGV